jgi:hypothetical protein
VETQTHDGCKLRLMTLIDEYTRECLAIRVARRINNFGVLESMADVMLMRGVPEHIRSDNGAAMTAKVVRNWLTQVGSKTLFIEPGSPWENGYCESLELLNGEIFYSLKEAKIVIEQWRNHYNTIRPHSSLGYRPPAPQTMKPVPDTARSGRANAIISPSRWYKKSVRPSIRVTGGRDIAIAAALFAFYHEVSHLLVFHSFQNAGFALAA